MKNQWVIKPTEDTETINQLIEKVWLPRPLAEILAQRGINNFELAENFFRPKLDSLYDSFLMADMDLAVQRILKAIQNQENILVYGDYDVDGTTSVAMMYDFLKSIYPNVSYYLPDRYAEGYGISFQGIDYAEQHKNSLIIALDCGIKAIDKVEYANSKKIDFIICDHHLPGDTLPNAVAVLDPKRKDCKYPFKELSGCGVGFKLIQALAEKMNLPKDRAFEYLDYLVVSIAADIVPIVDENRVFAHYGLKALQKSPRPGLAALLGEVNPENLTISNIVFSIAPKINASGRIEHASQSVELLISKDKEDVKNFTSKINAINDRRKEEDGSVTEQAKEQILTNKEEDKFTTVVYHPNWHKGVLGIVASRLIENYYRPTLVLTDGNDGEITGSARSVKDFDIYEVIDECSPLLLRYGGHRFAAGLTLSKENFPEFKSKFEDLVKEKIKPIQREPSIEINTEIQFSEINDKFLRILKQMEPFGPENMTPLFLTRNLFTDNVIEMGKNGGHLRFSLIDSNNNKMNAVAFGFGDSLKDFQNGNLDVVYSIEENHFKNKVYLQLNIRDVKHHY